jgi:hypothetical protein
MVISERLSSRVPARMRAPSSAAVFGQRLANRPARATGARPRSARGCATRSNHMNSSPRFQRKQRFRHDDFSENNDFTEIMGMNSWCAAAREFGAQGQIYANLLFPFATSVWQARSCFAGCDFSGESATPACPRTVLTPREPCLLCPHRGGSTLPVCWYVRGPDRSTPSPARSPSSWREPWQAECPSPIRQKCSDGWRRR